MATAHNSAAPGSFARTVLMPGDPLRSRWIAQNFLTDARLVNDVRGVQGYTGLYNGRKVSVMASGMGMPSMGIYSYELFTHYGVEKIVRIGSAGSLSTKVHMRDLVFGMGACTTSRYAAQYRLSGTFAPIASFSLLRTAVQIAESAGCRFHVGNLLTSDTFYDEHPEDNEAWGKMGVLAVEMECAALYMNAARLGKEALAVCTVSDVLITGESLSADERQSSFTEMTEIALRTAAALSE